MTTWPAITGKALVAALKKNDFVVARIKGSHHILKHTDGRMTIVPVHAGETIGTGLLAQDFAGLRFVARKTARASMTTTHADPTTGGEAAVDKGALRKCRAMLLLLMPMFKPCRRA